MRMFKYPKFLLVIPAVLLMVTVYSIGINTFLAAEKYRSYDVDSAGPEMQLNHISKGFFRDNIPYGYSIFHSMVMSLVHVPYIWTRTSVLPPYNLNALDKSCPSLKHELIILMRSMNLIAAVGMLLIIYYLTWLFCKNPLPPFLVSLFVVFNPNLMFQTGCTYYENWSVFWAVLSVLCFVKCVLEKTKTFFWFSAFFIIAALAVSCHERMAGYYIFTVPFLVYNFYKTARKNKKTIGSAILLIFAALGMGFIVFCLANSVFISGFGPVLEYFRSKTAVLDKDPDRYNGILRFLGKQFRCQRHALYLIIFNLGGIVPFFSLCGLWTAWKKKIAPALAILLFPLGYQVLSVGLPGWTAGRYIMGQTIFATLYAGLGIAWCIEQAKKANKMGWFWAVVIFALVSQLFLVAAVKFADNHYNPYRAIENIIKDPTSKGKRIVVQGISFPSGLFRENKVTYEVIPTGENLCPGADIIISKNEIGCGLYKKEFRYPPRWLVSLAGPKGCYLFIQFEPFVIERCDNAHGAHKKGN